MGKRIDYTLNKYVSTKDAKSQLVELFDYYGNMCRLCLTVDYCKHSTLNAVIKEAKSRNIPIELYGDM